MKLLQIFESLIIERRNVGRVYHFTSLDNMFKIMDSDKLNGQTYHSSMDFINKYYGKQYKMALSTTRDKNFENSRVKRTGVKNSNVLGGTDIIIAMNGDLLSDKYKTSAYDDFSPSKLSKKMDITPENDEMEQVWFGNSFDADGGIRNVSKYIEYVEFTDEFTDVVRTYSRSYIDRILELITILKNKGISYKFEDKNFESEFLNL